MALALITHPVFADHEVPRGHPESGARMTAAAAGLQAFDATALHALNQTWQQSSSLRNELRRIGVNLNQIATSANAGRLLEQSLMAAQADLQAAMKRLDENADRAAGIINSMEDGDEEDQP